MEINKILLTSFNQTSLLNSEITKETVSANELSQLNLQDTDENAELIQKECSVSVTGGLDEVNSDNVDELLRDSNGVTYIIAGNNGCSRCKTLASTSLEQVVENMEGEANFLHVDTDSDLYKSLKKEAGCSKGLGWPAIFKCVDGKAVEVINFYEIKGIYTNADKLTEFLEKKTGNISNNNETKAVETNQTEDDTQDVQTSENSVSEDNSSSDSEETTTSDNTNTSEVSENSENNDEKLVKQELAKLKASIQAEYTQIIEDISTDTLESTIETATSISDLKNAVINNSTGMDFSTQINLQSLVNRFDDDTDLSKAKEELLKLI